MDKVKIKVSNNGKKDTQYHYTGSQGVLNVNSTKEISINIGDTLYFENDGSTKYVMTEKDNGETFYYSK